MLGVLLTNIRVSAFKILLSYLLITNYESWAFSSESFVEHAHKKHKDFAIGAPQWVDESRDECSHRFEFERWPCHPIDHIDIIVGNSTIEGTREAAFVQALTAASIIKTSLQLCLEGNDFHCDCQGHDKNDRFGTLQTGDESSLIIKCSEPFIKYAVGVFSKYRKKWVGRSDKKEDLMTSHNTETGKRVLVKGKDEKCSCHGMSGSCSSKTCWVELPQMRHVSALLKSTYNSNRLNVKTVIGPANKKKKALLTLDGMSVSRNNLVFIQDSPSYCEYMLDRNCSREGGESPQEKDKEVPKWEKEHRKRQQMACDRMCDDCDLEVMEQKLLVKNAECACVFHWCCTVNCTSCEQEVTLKTCTSKTLYDLKPIRLPPREQPVPAPDRATDLNVNPN